MESWPSRARALRARVGVCLMKPRVDSGVQGSNRGLIRPAYGHVGALARFGSGMRGLSGAETGADCARGHRHAAGSGVLDAGAELRDPCGRPDASWTELAPHGAAAQLALQ